MNRLKKITAIILLLVLLCENFLIVCHSFKAKNNKDLIYVGERDLTLKERINIYGIYIKNVEVEPIDVQEVEEMESNTNIIVTDIPCYTHGITSITQDEYNLLCRVAMSEGGGLDIEAIIAIVETILNRVASPNFPNTIKSVIYQKNQYWTGNNGEPNERVDQAVAYCLEVQTHPSNMYYFRTGHYHKFAKNYKKIDGVYFSLRA